MMNKIKALTQYNVVEWKNAREIADEFEAEIIKRIDYIITTIFKAFDLEVENWWFPNAAEGSIGDLEEGFNINSPTVNWSEIYFKNDKCWDDRNFPIILLKNKKEFGFDCHEFPTRWLFEDFEQELIEGKEAYLKMEAEKALSKKEKASKKKKEYAELVNQIKTKLTEEELAILKKEL